MNLVRSILIIGLLLSSCGYRYYAGHLEPVPEEGQAPGTVIQDDGTVVFVKERLEISLRPMTDEEMNRQFSTHSQAGVDSKNPFTFGDWQEPRTGETPSRFAIFRLKVKNYTYPKVLVDPLKVRMTSGNGRQYRPLSALDLDDYFLTYATGYAGNKHMLYRERVDILNRTLFKGDLVFSGQETEGFLVFPILHMDVEAIRVELEDVALRFDFRNEPLESVNIEYAFRRAIKRLYPGKQGGELNPAGS